MSRRERLPVALTIAGSDSGGGAGMQADLKTFAGLGVHGASVITCVTAQNPRRVTGIQAIRPEIIRLQMAAIFDELPPRAAKTGMLFSADIIHAVADRFSHGRRLPLVVDPVMVSTRGAVLLKPSAIRVLKERLLPLATLVTPNLHEAGLLTGCKLVRLQDLRTAARQIHEAFGCAVLVKGGHLRDAPLATDVLYDGFKFVLLVAPFVRNMPTHGTGCTYSAAITAMLARGRTLPTAVKLAKRHITAAIARSYLAGRHHVLDHGLRATRSWTGKTLFTGEARR